MSKTNRTMWAILCLIALGWMMIEIIIDQFEGQSSFFRFAIVSIVVLVIVGLARWLWRNRDVIPGVHLVPTEKDMLRQALTEISFPKRVSSVEEAILNLIRTHLHLWSGGKAIVGPQKDALLVKWVFDHEYVEKERIARAVHDRLCEIGREVYEWHIRSPLTNYPDHSASPEALGYAILHGVVSDEEVLKIRFDHDETAEEYRKMAEGMLEKVMAQLAAGETYFDFSGLSDTADYLCCCH